MYFPSGEIAARMDFPLLVICEMLKFWNGIGGGLGAQKRIDAVARACDQEQRHDRDARECAFVLACGFGDYRAA